ncbi:hypothetical protein, conserved [Eimeria tenella]|uniref:UspA domain-containing protein n=1 Tax=Eimeria tenella TaxID=5802 RepID=U6KQ39_EIMTE|nr:hypothetical protein, conserved [Eimeria tenella]CDJ37558.1 hypothetical protein, conserved [Eimeria tenella]|eukprot:XP_013228396.1 hypothetical protein, conserved [Eimeria tenella]
MTRATDQDTVRYSTVLPSNNSSFSSLDGYTAAAAAAGAAEEQSKGWALTVDPTAAATVAAAAAAVLSGTPYSKWGKEPAAAGAAAAAAPAAPAAAACSCSDSSLLSHSCACCLQQQQQQKQQQQLAQLFSCCDTTSVDALLLGLLAKISAEHPQLLQQKFLRLGQTSPNKLNEKGQEKQQQQQQAGGSSSSCGQRIVVIGLQFRSSSRDLRLLWWARRHLLQQTDVVVLVSCWEIARDPKYARVPGMILAATSAAGAYNRQQQQHVQQRMHDMAEISLNGLHVYCLAVPISSTSKTSVGDLLCRVSRQLRADVMLLGARSHWQLRRILFGSVASYARAHAKCPVLQCANA